MNHTNTLIATAVISILTALLLFLITSLRRALQQLHPIVKERLGQGDASMRRKVVKEEQAYRQMTSIFEFEIGQLVVQRTKRIGKLT
jgi:hypothetical protein